MGIRRANPYLEDRGAPPATVDEGRNIRQRARACGLNPNYWYIAEHSYRLKVGQRASVTFWKRPIVIYRGSDRRCRGLEDCCAHRQVKLSAGSVEGCNLTCMYHGWSYDEEGKVALVHHEDFGDRGLPRIRVPRVPVQERYGMIWIFPGDPALADQVPIPSLPELEGSDAWPCVPVDFTWPAHHSMVLDNVSDYSHGWLHRRYEPFRDPRLTHFESTGDAVHVRYDAKIGAGKLMNAFVNRRDLASNSIDLWYQYPYHTSNIDDFIKHFISVRPIDERTSRVFFLFYYKRLKIPFVPVYIPKGLMVPIIRVANRFIVKKVLDQDGRALELEQQGWERDWHTPWAEKNPIVKEFQELTIRKWKEYLASRQGTERLSPVAKSSTPAQASTA